SSAELDEPSGFEVSPWNACHSSVGVLVDDAPENSEEDGREVEADAPVTKIIEIVLNALGDRGITAQTVDFQYVCSVVHYELSSECPTLRPEPAHRPEL